MNECSRIRVGKTCRHNPKPDPLSRKLYFSDVAEIFAGIQSYQVHIHVWDCREATLINKKVDTEI